jgi:hypothetical protein
MSVLYEQICQLPCRVDLLNYDAIRATNVKIRAGEPIIFTPCYLQEQHMSDAKYQKSTYKIILCGSLQDGRKATVILNDADVYFEVRLKTLDTDTEIAYIKTQVLFCD